MPSITSALIANKCLWKLSTQQSIGDECLESRLMLGPYLEDAEDPWVYCIAYWRNVMSLLMRLAFAKRATGGGVITTIAKK
mmetsp:Transcript_69826/g.109283  ORF Transcript_69826/g.109283 Transcript_69826/m.109283 type:complete len:81 (-) Transcript_69826:87-329(-)